MLGTSDRDVYVNCHDMLAAALSFGLRHADDTEKAAWKTLRAAREPLEQEDEQFLARKSLDRTGLGDYT